MMIIFKTASRPEGKRLWRNIHVSPTQSGDGAPRAFVTGAQVLCTWVREGQVTYQGILARLGAAAPTTLDGGTLLCPDTFYKMLARADTLALHLLCSLKQMTCSGTEFSFKYLSTFERCCVSGEHSRLKGSTNGRDHENVEDFLR